MLRARPRYAAPRARAPRPAELARPAIFWRGHVLSRRLQKADLTVVPPRHARTLYRLARTVEHERVPGVFVECGVCKGGSTLLLSDAAPKREIWAFDSFEGLPVPSAMDGDEPPFRGGELRASPRVVEAAFELRNRVDRLRLVAGWFEDTLATAAEEIDRVALLHVDADLYEPVKLALETFCPKLSRGGYVAVDDYSSFVGARRATDEVRARYRISSPIVWAHYWRQ
jgi:hypothetical protein